MESKKNLWLIPTDKESILFIDKYDKKLRLFKKPMVSEYAVNQNIYITSDGEIKEGDYYYNERLNKIFQAIAKSGYNTVDKEFKIILTTDKDLIKDGVQAIDDQFLEWFVKNPNCEFVEPERGFYENAGKVSYKIIIPKEEHKQGTMSEAIKQVIENKIRGINVDTGYKLQNKETLEEAAKRAVKSGLFKDETLFIVGGKWQKERMYSELVDLLERLTTIYKEDSDLHQIYDKKRLEFIKQFKKQ